jgi:probable rRNA maturation factor
VITVDIENRSGAEVDEPGAVELAGRVLRAEGIDDGELGIAFVGADEMRDLKREHLGIDEATDVLSFPIDGRSLLPEGVPRQLGDLVVCPAVASAEGTPIATLLVHGALHLMGYDHEADGGAMLARQNELLSEVSPVVADPA